MTPAQKLALETKLSVQRVNQLAQWLDHNRHAVGDCEAGLREALRTLLVRFDGLQHAIDMPPTIGVIGEPGSGKSQLVRAMTALGDGRDTSRARLPDAEVLRNLLFQDGDVSCSAAVRLRSAGPQGAAREHPFRIGLLGLADVAAIMVRVYCTGYPRARAAEPSLLRIAAIYEEVSRNLQAGNVPGFTDHDVYALRETLDTLYPDFEGLRLLSAAGYWDDLAEVAAHIPDAERLKVLSLLWGEEPELTRIFTHLGETLARLGFVTEAFCPREALIELDASSGWLRRHSESIIECSTLAQIGDDRGATLHVVGRYGQAATVTRAAMTALVADLTLAVASVPLANLKPAEIVAFPSVAAPDDLATIAAPTAPGAGGSSALGPLQIARLYARAKAAHLFDRAAQRHEVTSLLVCVDPTAEANDTLQAPIGDWIDLTQGYDPYLREQRRGGLFVVASEPTDGHGRALLDRDGMCADLADTLAAELTWPREWAPERPFLNVLEHHAGPRAGQANTSVRERERARREAGDVRLIGARAGIAARSGEPGPQAADADPGSGNGGSGVEAVLAGVAPVCQTSTRQRQLRRQLGDLHRRLRSRFVRFHADGELVEWRQRVAAVIEHRLYRVVRHGKLGLLLKSLTVSEAELLALYQRSRRQPFEAPVEFRASAVPGAIDIEIAGEHVEISTVGIGRAEGLALAAQAVGHWQAAMRRSARSARLCRDIGIGEAVLEHIIDEIGIAASRLGLVRRVADAIEGSLVHGEQGGRLFASAVGPVINGFVETLQLDGEPARDDDLAMAADVAEHGAAHGAATAMVAMAASARSGAIDAPRARAYPGFHARLENRWCVALAGLIEANIIAVRYAHGGGANSDLGRLLSQLPFSHTEVEL